MGKKNLKCSEQIFPKPLEVCFSGSPQSSDSWQVTPAPIQREIQLFNQSTCLGNPCICQEGESYTPGPAAVPTKWATNHTSSGRAFRDAFPHKSVPGTIILVPDPECFRPSQSAGLL